MALTKEFSETVKARVDRDAEFRLALFKEALDCFLEGDVVTGKGLLKDYINATVGFEALADRVRMSAKSLHRMLGPKGNPRAENLFRVLGALRRSEHVDAKVHLVGDVVRGMDDLNAGQTLGVREMRARYHVRKKP